MSLPTERPATELAALLNTPAAPYLLDVREPDEFAEWSIPGAVNIPLGALEERVEEVPHEGPVVVICAKGARAMSGATILLAHGYDASVLEGGMAQWGVTYDTVRVELGGAVVVQVRRRGKGCLSYVVSSGSRAAVIDPSLDVEMYRALAAEEGAVITHIVDTHLHADHVSGGRLLRDATGAELILNPSDPFDFDYSPLVDGTSVELGDGVHLAVEALRAPGHTEGSTVFRLGSAALFTGDTLFLESVGRPDLADQAESFARALYRTLHERILPLADDIVILPAHWGDAITVRSGELVARKLGELRHVLPALAYSEEDFVSWAVRSVKDRPPNYVDIVKFNAGISELSLADVSEKELGPNRCAIA